MPAAALRTATINPAVFLGMSDSLGTIARGTLAELVLLDGNPLVDIRSVSRIAGVSRAGTYMDRAELDFLLAALAREVSAPAR